MFETPDKANAFFIATSTVAMDQEDPDYPALYLANFMLGGNQSDNRLWNRIREELPPGGRFSGQWYGPRDSWVGRPGMTFVGRDEALALLDGFELEMFEEEEADGTTPRGNAKHWHIFHIVARKLA